MRNPTYYQQFRKKKCERCGYKAGGDFKLHVHHKNHKHWDDREENLETLCELCHVGHHRKPKKKFKKLAVGWLFTHYSTPGGVVEEEEKPKGILDHFM